jgi:hypothetical protein
MIEWEGREEKTHSSAPRLGIAIPNDRLAVPAVVEDPPALGVARSALKASLSISLS